MTRAAPAAALIMVLLGAAAVMLVPASPGALTRIRPAELWGGRQEGAGESAGSNGSATTVLPIARATIHVLEQVSPIVGPASTLVESLGIEMRERFTTVLPKGTPVPVKRVVTFRTGADDQKEIRLHVLRGVSETAADNHSLGWVRVADLPPGPRGSTRIAVLFEVADGAIVLAAVDPETGRAFPIEAAEPPPGFKP